MSKRRPLSIAHVSAERGHSGGEVQVLLLLEGLRAGGHRVRLLHAPGAELGRRAHERGFATRAVAMRHSADAAGLWRLRRALADERPDLVHLHSGHAAWLGGFAARSLGLPALATRRQDRRVRSPWRARALHGRLLTRTVAISRALADQLAAVGVDSERLSVISSSVDPEALEPRRPRDAVRRELGAPDDAPVLLTAAALHPRKGVDVLLDALARLAKRGPSPELWVAGAGPERAALERRAQALGLGARVQFLGERPDVADLLGACDVFVLPSRREGLGVAALEAMAAGRPVVASRAGGLAETVLDGETGRLVRREDAGRLADALEELLADPARAREMGAAGQRRVRARFAPAAMVAAYEDLYREICAP